MKNNKIRIWQKGEKICWSYGRYIWDKNMARFGKAEINLGKKGWNQIGTFISKTGIHGNCGLGSATGIKS